MSQSLLFGTFDSPVISKKTGLCLAPEMFFSLDCRAGGRVPARIEGKERRRPLLQES